MNIMAKLHRELGLLRVKPLAVLRIIHEVGGRTVGHVVLLLSGGALQANHGARPEPFLEPESDLLLGRVICTVVILGERLGGNPNLPN